MDHELILTRPRLTGESTVTTAHMDRGPRPATQFEVDVDLGFALFFLALLCFFLLATVVRCAQTVVDPYGSISTSTYEEEQIN
ncbi:cortexin domain-containing 1 protein-like [Limanda limanda]|uniref:cortexin domain-containing 1 protein-like n=1 Tax=Limanda limanda TaxID=27771 RepID=UPI0029C675E7|nr:cortexin domain-containing 1 protein-like [Limanda limanda]